MAGFVMLLVVLVACWLVPLLAATVGVRVPGRRVDNYRGVAVPQGLGWAWAAWGLVALGAGFSSRELSGLLPVGGLVAGTALLGWVDDTYGSAEERGLAGHLAAVRRGRVTTGLVKLVGIGALSLWATWGIAASTAEGAVRVAAWLLGAIVIAGTANLLNLLDVRPGRALKVYALVAVPCAIAEVARGGWNAALAWLAATVVLAVLGPALASWRADLGEKAMLGDMGANAAGALAGWLLASVLPLPGLVVAAVAVVALNLASERVSFSAVIENDALLNRLDEWGRPERVTAEAHAERGETGS